tara:strand:+ start:123 stop:362 length:240 start_codon:yes stop_codon:yes gene_type:complete
MKTKDRKLRHTINQIIKEARTYHHINDDCDQVLKRFCKLVGIDFNEKRELANYFSDQAADSGFDKWGNRLPKIDTYEEQ